MNKYKISHGFSFLIFSGIFFSGIFINNSAFATTDNLSITRGEHTKASQKLNTGQKNVGVYNFIINNLETSSYSPGATITEIRIRLNQLPSGQILRYKLWDDQIQLGTVSLPNSKELTFDKLTLTLPALSKKELSLTADISYEDGINGIFNYQVSGIKTLLGNVVLNSTIPTSNKISIGENPDAPALNADCNLREEPVCGADGRTYFNRCLTFQKGINVLYEGICREETKKRTDLWNCTGTAEPICGVDGKTYTNRCYLNRNEIAIAYTGACFPKKIALTLTYQESYDLFVQKKDQLLQIRPRISEVAAANLDEIAFTLISYNFLESTREDIIRNIGNFINFSQNKTDRGRMESEIINLKKVLINAKRLTRASRYESGENPFLDTDKGDWFTKSVRFLKEKQWISGYLDKDGNQTGLFRPEQTVTKAEITKMVFSVATLAPEASLTGPKNNYAKNHWAKDYIDKAEKSAFTLWKEDTNPEKKATRSEILQLLFEAFSMQPQTKLKKGDKIFTDVPKDNKNADFIYYGQYLDIIEGYNDGSFKPKKTVSRAEAAKIIERAFHKIPRAEHLEISPLAGSQYVGVTEVPSNNEITDISNFPEAEAPEVTSINSRISAQMKRYAVPYISPNYHFYMEVPGLYRFQTFDPIGDEIMRFGFSKSPMISESDVSFWLKIIATSSPLTTDRYTPSTQQIQWDFPRKKSENTFFRLEGAEIELEAMEMMKDSILYSNPEEIPSE